MIFLLVVFLSADPARVTSPYNWPVRLILPPISSVENIDLPPIDDPLPSCVPANDSCEFPDGK